MEAELRLAPFEGRIVDMGCGQGVITTNLAWKRPRAEVIGIDPNEERLQVGQLLVAEHGLKNCTFKKGSIEDPGVEPASCTGVFCTEVLDHIPNVREVLKEKVASLLKLLRPGGRLVLSVLDDMGTGETGITVASPLKFDDFGFLPGRRLDRNCPRWWHLFYADKR
jgi:2-polyprenyl-3-methyl-5-hydroxy-6-metoxy-1,4-benzoquinol methylase